MPTLIELVECSECGMRDWHEFDDSNEMSFNGDGCYNLDCTGEFEIRGSAVLIE